MDDADAPRTSAAEDTVSRAVLEALDGLEDRPVGEHVEVLEQVNRTIAAELAALDEV